MAYARDEYTASLLQTNFDLTFPYLDEDHVLATVDAVAETAFTFVDADTIAFDTPMSGGEAVVIYRSTPHTALVSFTSGTPVTQENMETLRKQLTYLVEEMQDYVDVATA